MIGVARLARPMPERAASAARSGARRPWLLELVVASTIATCMLDGVTVFGASVTGYAWAVPCYLALVVVLRDARRAAFPLAIWLPWLAVVAVSLIGARAPAALQRSLLLASPVLVGLAVSCADADDRTVARAFRLVRLAAAALLLTLAVRTGLLATGHLQGYGAFAPEATTAALLAGLLGAPVALGSRRTRTWWAAVQLAPVMALTRTAIAATMLTLPLTLAPLPRRRRALYLALIAAAALLLFNTARVQERMFASGHGTVADIRLDNPNLLTSGRTAMWRALGREIPRRLWLGHGANASEPFVLSVHGAATHPHNDWLRLLFDYGLLGTAAFTLGMVLQARSLLRRARGASPLSAALAFSAASAFVPFVLLMLTDNVILYAAFFGNLHFALIGLVYARTRAAPLERPPVRDLALASGAV